ncbi:uncharacterized protein OCT59_016360 [Rhizophagus irregularis]|uniref:Uncharacterized protein n=2 Tax=Rhizophagus irregularis TaxID=588596 RepID=A0A2I1EK65_9GLOM|nr:hypothetical protein RirG_181450 [Rhizophagus irregularis DAOM 197198w]PKY22519.1 hypothetical protein RhiirB3_369319 [Rhizophagus irregularis]GBC31405.2 protein stu1 [Rhizophagus irregularis DAOM 181602=DAOM 197198]UZO24033.1 hypothetical protein OCT59_016360 [Rhizophagus irregularis]CAB4477302.1 unnamed protein product [Rhizophagus irregularis]
MAGVPTEIKVESASQLDNEIKQIVERFQEKETEHTWSGFDDSLTRLIAITRGGAVLYEKNYILGIKSLRQPIINSILTERTKLSGTATELIEEMAKALGLKFDALSEIFVPSIIKLCTRTKKTSLIRAQKCMNTIIRICHLPNLIPKFKEALQHQSKSLRNCAAEWVRMSLEANEVGDLNYYISDIEWAIRQCASDSSSEVRNISKQIFEIYKSKFDLRLENFVATVKKDSDVLKILGIKDKSAKVNNLAIMKAQSRKINNVRDMQNDVIIFANDEDKLQINNKNEDKEQIAKDKKLPLNDNSLNNEDTTAFTIPFGEPQNAVGALSTATGFVTLKRPKLTSAQHKSQPVITTTAQRVPAKPTRAQTINTSSSINRDAGTGTGGAQRVRTRERAATATEDKNKASRVLNTNKIINTKPSRPPYTRTTSEPATNPTKKKTSHKFNIKSKAAPLINNKTPLKKTNLAPNSVFKPLKVTATSTSMMKGFLTTANLCVTISTATKQSNSNQMENSALTNMRLFGRSREHQRQCSPYQKPAINFVTRKFGRPLPNREELTAKVNALANHAIEVVMKQVEASYNLNVEVTSEEQMIEDDVIENSTTSRVRPPIKQQLPATQDITPLPVEPSPPLSFVDPVKFLEDVRKIEVDGCDKADKVTGPEVGDLIEKTKELTIEGQL